MRILKVNPNNPDHKTIDYAINILCKGGIIVYPTDTCYGLGADMTNFIAVNKIYRIKSRADHKPMSVIAKNISSIKKFALVESKEEQILRQYLPGAITFILLNLDFENFSQNTVGVRIPKYKITQLIADKFGKPYATTSANIAGAPPCYSVESILEQFKDNKTLPNLILDVGTLETTPPSTIVNLTSWPPKIIRHGPVKFKCGAAGENRTLKSLRP